MKFQFTYGANSAQAPDVVVKFISRTQLENDAAFIQPQLDAEIRRLHARGLFTGEKGQKEAIATLGLHEGSGVLAVGFSGGAAADELRDLGASAAKSLKKLRARAVKVLLPQSLLQGTADCQPERAAQSLVEGIVLGWYERPKRKAKHASTETEAIAIQFVPEADVQEDDSAAARWSSGMKRGELFADGAIFARDLTNMPGNELVPEGLAEYAEEIGHRYDFDVEIMDEYTIVEHGMGGLIGVGKGSSNPPRMIVLHYEGAPDSKEVWAIIGKGITFDTGGISLKRAEGMEEMIGDMGGAAAVLGAMRIIGELKPKVNVLAVIAAAENMPSDRALKPGDVIVTMSGKTVEVVNTDAEGRLVLADAVTTAVQRGATRLIDVATLTGAVETALGNLATGAVGNDELLIQDVIRAGRQSGERIWPLPSYPEYKKQLDSDAADMKNSGGRLGGAITGGLFVGAFAEDRPWVHLDIAGTSWLNSARNWESKGATGVMVRTLAELLSSRG
ncbi:leucyl aminopeptidase [Paenibacillus cellulosilyticus]|uniref:Probable cytosol aminopeptidase n=1 Tax=Paenibacillus cellulosilyticus TaxID=375489 RepID=A0A2V2Z086_9BACL|nr:leucyl aminopeptidase [Paenibacillus cellulosilyticus]PWW07457.1 leucyl aminopeptidase [Paenibacillus cellulosilyticus]QKS44385.1 leucyl aminopeptidase [Paenibacillus cellulosilyticus]